MWAQLITVRVKPGKEGDLSKIADLLRAAEQADSGLVRETIMQDQKDPNRVYVIAVFESEEKARARENDPRRAEGLAALRAFLGDVSAGPPEFVDLTVREEITLLDLRGSQPVTEPRGSRPQ